MSRRATKEKPNSLKKTSSSITKRRVIITKKEILTESSDNDPAFVQLRHPSSANPASFLFNGQNTLVQEVLRFSDSKRSYFVDDTVCSDGDLYICTPIDPLFLVLPYLIKTKQCCPLDQILVDEEFPETGRLLTCLMDVSLIADQRGDDYLKAYIYNEEKTLLWLQLKLERLVGVLKAKNINTSKTVSVSANFVKNNEEEDSGVNYIRYAYGMLLDYIPEQLGVKFAEFIKLPPEPEKSAKRKEITSPNPSGKRIKVEDEEEYSPTTPVVKQKKKTASLKEQKLAKAAKGSMSISSFFKKK